MQSSISGRIAESVDHEAATPLYHQIAAVVRWEISQGRLPIGAMLPPVREIAARAGVNYHTVRRAWGELEAEGVVSQRRGRGATVVRQPLRGGWTPAGSDSAASPEADRVWVVADALEEAAHLAVGLMGRWRVEAIPWPSDAAPPPPGPILCTTAAEPGLRARWLQREGDLRPLPTALDQATLGVLRRNAAHLGTSRVLIHGSAADPAVRELLRQLPRVGLRASAAADDQSSGAEEGLSLYFPVAWAALAWADRMHPRAVAAVTEWSAGPVAGVARELDWVVR